MDTVVRLDEFAGRKRKRKRAKREKAALVLGGGGITGGVYEIGALRAFDLLAVNRTVNEFDVYVGTSAGSFVASMLANGVTPEEMMRVLNKGLPSEIDDPELKALLKFNYGGLASSVAKMPLRIAATLKNLIGNVGEVSLVDLATGLSEGLPKGLYSNHGIEEYMNEVLSREGRSNDFREVDADLFITACDLDTCERVVLGRDEWAGVPISQAVAASGALPVVYEPYSMRGRQLIDGGIYSTTNVDVAVEEGATFIVVVNPMVPYVNDFQRGLPTASGSKADRVGDMGMAAIANQSFRMMAHNRLHRALHTWDQAYPDVDIILIEPALDDALMFGTSILDYKARLAIAKHGFESVTIKLAKDYQHYKEIAARHGIEISARRVDRVLDTVDEADEGISAWRKVLEQTTSALLRQSGEREAAKG